MTTDQPTRRISARERRLLERAQRDITNIKKALNELDPVTLTEIICRARHTATDALAGGTGGAGNDVSKPTDAAAMRDAGGRIFRDEDGNEVCTPDTWQPPADPVRQAIRDLLGQLSEAAGTIDLVKKRRDYIMNIGETGGIRNALTAGAGDCAACTRVVTGAVGDKLVSGYCPACRKAWERANYPDRVQFERDRRAKTPEVAAPLEEVRQEAS